jgi:hypothetical protein
MSRELSNLEDLLKRIKDADGKNGKVKQSNLTVFSFQILLFFVFRILLKNQLRSLRKLLQ